MTRKDYIAIADVFACARPNPNRYYAEYGAELMTGLNSSTLPVFNRL